LKRLYRCFFVSLAALSIMLGIFITADAQSNKNIFFDDFTFELSDGNTDLFVGHTGSGSLKTRDTDRGYYVLSKDSETDKTTVDPAFKTPSFIAETGKTVLEFRISHTGAQDYSVQLYNEDNALLTLVDKETEKGWIDYKAIFDFENKSVSLYKNGTLSAEYEIATENTLIGQQIQFRFLGYHIKSLTAEVLFDYINIYKYDSNIISIENSENTDVNKINVQFFAPLAGELTADKISVEGAQISSVTKKNGALNLYEIAFEEKLNFGTGYELELDSSYVLGYIGESINSSFTTRARQFNVMVPQVSSDTLSNGEFSVTLNIDNETLSPKDVLLNITLYEGNKMLWTKFVPYTILSESSIGEDDSATVTVTLSGITENSIMKVILFDNVNSFRPYSPLITVTATGKTVKDAYAGDRNGNSSARYEFDPDNLIVNTQINVSEEGKENLFVGFMIDEETSIADIYLSNPEKIIYFTYDILTDRESDIEYVIPDASNNYKFWWISGADSQLNSIDMDIYSTQYIQDALADISAATTPEVLWNKLNTYEDAFQLDVADTFEKNLYLSILELKGGTFSTAEQLKSAFNTANTLVYKNTTNIDDIVKAINDKTPIATYSLYKEELSQNAVEYVKEKLSAEITLTEEKLAEKFKFYVITGGVHLAENYKQVQKIIEDTTAITLIELNSYNALSSEKKKSAVLSVLGNLYENYTGLKSAFETAVNKQGENTPGGGGGNGGGGSSGGGGTTKNVYDTPKSYPLVEKVSETPAFSDMENHSWAKDAVEHLVSVKAISGKAPGEFCPDDFITREEAAKIVAVAFDLKTDSETSASFADVGQNDWSREYILAVMSNGIINGIDNKTFGKNVLLSRQMLATILYRITDVLNVKIEDKALYFDDMNAVDEYAKEAVSILYGNSLINGVGDNRFSPVSNCTRAEAAKMISDFLKFCESEGK